VRSPATGDAPHPLLGTAPVRLLGKLYVVAGEKLSHPWDANAYLLGGDEPVLIDCGSSVGYPALKHNLEALGYSVRDIRKVLVTHCHWDHLSGMSRLREESAAELCAHADDREAIETGDEGLTASYLYGQPFPALAVDRTVSDGDVLKAGGCELRIHHTPGHTPGSICLETVIEGLRVLITGDTVWGAFHPKIRSDLEAWSRSLDRLLELDFDGMAIGHSPPMLIFDAKRKLEEARQQFGVYFNPWFKPFNLTFRY
jgi:hydroxyacylglutathione hydrolase